MSKKNQEVKSVSPIKYIIIAVCVALIVTAGILLGISSKKEDSEYVVTSTARNDELGINSDKYELVQSGAKRDNPEKYYVKLEIGSINPKRFVAGNYINTTFYALYEDGYGYQYNSDKKTNERNSFKSELKVLDMTVSEAYWLEYNSHKIYLYFAENNGVYNAIISNFAF